MQQRDEVTVDYWNKAAEVGNYLVENFPDRLYVTTITNNFFHALCDLALEHHGAILTLVSSNQHDGSALALLRSLIEASIKALWVLKCSSVEILLSVKEDPQRFPSMEACRVELADYYKRNNAEDVMHMSRNYKNDLNGFAHNGIEQIAHRFDSDLNITPSYPPQLIQKLLQQSTMWLTMAFLERIQSLEGSEHVLSPNTERLTRFYLARFQRPTQT